AGAARATRAPRGRRSGPGGTRRASRLPSRRVCGHTRPAPRRGARSSWERGLAQVRRPWQSLREMHDLEWHGDALRVSPPPPHVTARDRWSDGPWRACKVALSHGFTLTLWGSASSRNLRCIAPFSSLEAACFLLYSGPHAQSVRPPPPPAHCRAG